MLFMPRSYRMRKWRRRRKDSMMRRRLKDLQRSTSKSTCRHWRMLIKLRKPLEFQWKDTKKTKEQVKAGGSVVESLAKNTKETLIQTQKSKKAAEAPWSCCRRGTKDCRSYWEKGCWWRNSKVWCSFESICYDSRTKWICTSTECWWDPKDCY